MDTNIGKNWLQRFVLPRAGVRETSIYLMLVMAVACYFLISMQIFSSNLNGHPVALSYLMDKDGEPLTQAQALSEFQAGSFTKTPDFSGQLDLGYQQRPVWLMMEFTPPETSSTESYIVQLRHAYLNGSFSDVVPTGDGAFQIIKTTEFNDKVLPRTQGMNDIRYISFPMTAKAGEKFFALMKLKAHVLSVQFVVQDEKDFLSSAIRELVPIAVLLGGLSFLAFYNLLVGIVRREPEFLFYGSYVCGVVLVAASINGTGHLFLWPDVLWMHYNSANMFINLANLSYLGFAHYMFKDTPFKKIERLVWQIVIGLCVLGLFLQIFEGGFYSSLQANLCLLSVLCLGLVRSLFARRQYGLVANLFILSELCLFGGVFVWCIKMFGLLPSTSFTLNLVLLSSSLEAVLFSFVLSEKMRRTLEEKEYAFSQLVIAHKELEGRVRDKTLALASRYTSHEVLNPVFAIKLKAERIVDVVSAEARMKQPSFEKIKPVVIEKCTQICSLLDVISGTIRTIKSISSISANNDMCSFNLSEAFSDARSIIEAKMLESRCEISSDFSAADRVFASRNDVIHVFVNLLSNSLDALHKIDNSWIHVESKVLQNSFQGSSTEVSIRVTDSGLGIDKSIQEKLFLEPVTTKHSDDGMGYGLRFCRQLLERNSGRIELDIKSLNTCFFFVLPQTGVSESEFGEYPKVG
ncbi:MAG: hypothetical protein RJB13_1565 [Pseudomonadota bacterium]